MGGLRRAWLPAAIVVLTALVAWLGPPLEESLSGLRTVGPTAVLVAAAGLTWWFNRGRSFAIAVSLLAAFAATLAWPGKPVYTALTVLVPLNALLAMVSAERGARHGAGWRWLALLALEAVLVNWIGRGPLSGGGEMFEHWALRSPPTPLVGRLAFAAAFAAAVCWRA